VNGIDQLAELFGGAASVAYLGEELTVAQHMLQAGTLAEEAGAADALVAAALLHDVGHLRETPTDDDDRASIDRRHSDLGADWLGQWFGPDVIEPIRLHVAAKRYLCVIEPGYFERLSAASVHTLEVQGGPMTKDEAAAFASLPYFHDAVSLRRWDELAKDPSIEPKSFDDFRPRLTAVLR
jgi:gamma-butyrobetaine dioxygenase